MKDLIIKVAVIGAVVGVVTLITNALWSNSDMNEAQREELATTLVQSGNFTQSEAYCATDVLDEQTDWSQYSKQPDIEEVLTPEVIDELESKCDVYYFPENATMTSGQREATAAYIADSHDDLTKEDGYCVANVFAKHFSAREFHNKEELGEIYTPEVVSDLETTCSIVYN